MNKIISVVLLFLIALFYDSYAQDKIAQNNFKHPNIVLL